MLTSRLGKQLLDEVREESLDEFLRDLRGTTLPERDDFLGVPKLDQLLSILRQPPPPRPTPRWGSPGIGEDGDDHEGNDHDDAAAADIRQAQLTARRLPMKPPIVEITTPAGPTPIVNSPGLRTALCLYLVALAVLPPRQEAAVYISTQGSSQFLARRLEQQMVQLLMIGKGEVNSSLSAKEAESIAHEALSHVHVLRPSSTAHLLATLRAMPEYLGDMTRHRSGNRRLALFVVDGVDTYHWQDRMHDDIERIDPTAREGNVADFAAQETHRDTSTMTPAALTSGQHETTPYSSRRDMAFSIQTLLRSLQREYFATIVLTTNPTTPAKSSHWPSFSTLRLEVSSLAPSVPLFAPHMSISEALLDRQKRKEVVQRGECVALAIEDPQADWRSDLRDKLESLGADGSRWRLKLTKNVVVANEDSG